MPPAWPKLVITQQLLASLPGSNFFMVTAEGGLVTPARDALRGIRYG